VADLTTAEINARLEMFKDLVSVDIQLA